MKTGLFIISLFCALFILSCDGEDAVKIDCSNNEGAVCGEVAIIEPCLSLPCPVTQHQTFDNICTAAANGGIFVQAGECGDREGEYVQSRGGVICTEEYSATCAKTALSDGEIACVTEPCPTHSYTTFSNACYATASLASIAFIGECAALEDYYTFEQPPITMTDSLPSAEKAVIVASSDISNNILTVVLEYSGCQTQHFSLYANTSFLESNPVQVETVFLSQVNDTCEAAWQSEHTYDLLPLKYKLQEAYGDTISSAIIQGLGTYNFD